MTSTPQLVQADTRGRVRRLWLNRPERLNALSSPLLGELEAAVTTAIADPSIGCIVIAGVGERAFSAGADLDEIRGLDVGQARAYLRLGHRVMRLVEDAPVPVVAAVDGYALGGGFELALSCHLLLASDRSRFGLPEARIGCMPGFGGTQRLRRAVGRPVAFDLLVTGQPIDAARADQVGLLSRRPMPPADFGPGVDEIAELIATGSRPNLSLILEAARTDPAAGSSLEHELALAATAIASADGQEGIAAFADRRQPSFAQDGT